MITQLETTKGFTLIEALVVVSIVGLLSTVVLTSLTNLRSKGRDSKRVADINNINKIIAEKAITENFYPLAQSGGIRFFSPTDGITYVWAVSIDSSWDQLGQALGVKLPKDPQNYNISASSHAYYLYELYVDSLGNVISVYFTPTCSGHTLTGTGSRHAGHILAQFTENSVTSYYDVFRSRTSSCAGSQQYKENTYIRDFDF